MQLQQNKKKRSTVTTVIDVKQWKITVTTVIDVKQWKITVTTLAITDVHSANILHTHTAKIARRKHIPYCA
jgi:hypothetical protein